MTDEPDRGRRSFLGTAATAITAARLGILGDATSTSSRAGHSAEVSSVKWPDAFAPIKQLDAGLLNVGYAESGPANGTPVILLHGWPYDIHSYSDVAPLLAAKGYRVIVPYLRGYGTTRFLAGDTVRNGQQSALAVDVVALMDALGIHPICPRKHRRPSPRLSSTWIGIERRCSAVALRLAYETTSHPPALASSWLRVRYRRSTMSPCQRCSTVHSTYPTERALELLRVAHSHASLTSGESLPSSAVMHATSIVCVNACAMT